MKRLINTTNTPLLIVRIVVGLIFFIRRNSKIYPGGSGCWRFTKIGFSDPLVWAHFAGSFKIVCGFMILIGLFVRVATIPLLIVMLVSFVTTKIPILTGKGFWAFAHEYKTDFAMTLLLILILVYGENNSGKKFSDR